MKNLLILFVLIFFGHSVMAQTLIDTKKVPANVQKTFKRKNSRAKEVKWFEDRDKRQYKVKFLENGVKCWVLTDYNGLILEKHTDVTYKALPEKIKISLKKDYKKLKFASAELIVKGRKDKYYSILMNESQGRKKKPLVWEIQYTMQGKFLTVYEPVTDAQEEDVENDKYDERMDEEAAELQGKAHDEKVDKKELPTAILDYLNKHYDHEYRAKKILIKSNSKYGEYYYIVMKKQGEKKEFVHYFDTNGKLLKKKEVDL